MASKRNGSNPHYLRGVMQGVQKQLSGIEGTQKEILRQQIRGTILAAETKTKIDTHLATPHAPVPPVSPPSQPSAISQPAQSVTQAASTEIENEKTDKAVGRTIRWIGTLIGSHWKTATIVSVFGLLSSMAGSCYGHSPQKSSPSISSPAEAAPPVANNAVKPKHHLEGGPKP